MRLRSSLLALGLLVGPGLAYAQDEEDPSGGEEPVDQPVQTETGKKDKKSKVQKLTAGGPTLKYEQFRRKIELKVAEKREEQIGGIKRLLDLGPEEKEIPDLKFRLAELYYEKSQFYFFRTQEAEEKATLAKTDGEKAAATEEQSRAAKESKTWLQTALDLYKEIRDKFPKYERTPEVLFALGQSYWNQGRFQAAIDVYADLIRNFRESPLVAEAWIAFGEFYFNEGDVNKALKSYEKAAEDKRSRVYGFALYKQAWCYYNLSDWQAALRKFKATVAYSQISEEMAGENKIALGREAQKDYVRAYSHVGDPKKAKFQFADLIGKDDCNERTCWTLLEQLGGLWYDEGYFEESASIYRQLIELNPKNSRNPLFQGKIVDLASRGSNKKVTINETRRLVDLFDSMKAQVDARTGKSEEDEKAREDIREAAVLVETTVRKLAQVWNREAKKTRTPATYEDAKVMYEVYLKLFPKSKFAYEMRFQLGDLYYRLEKFDDAAQAYEATVVANTDPKAKYLVDACNDNILALEELIKDQSIKKPKDNGAPQELHPLKKRLVEACDRYVKFVPAEKADKLVAVKLKAARLYYDYFQYEEALRRFDLLVREHPEAEQAEFAANLVIDIYNVRKDWESLYKYANEYLKLDALIKDREKLKTDLLKFSEYAKFSMVQILENRVKTEKGNLCLVAQAYQEFYEEFPKSENADKALFNASVAWDQCGQKEKSDQLRQRLLAEYPNSPLGADVAYYIAKQAEERTQFKDAADRFLAFARKHKTDERARDALYNAAVFYAGVGQVSQANKLREEYLEQYGKAKGGEKESAAIFWSSAKDLDRAGRWRQAADRYADYSKQFRNTPELWDALWREAEIRREKLREQSKAEKIERDILGTYKALRKKGQEVPLNARRYASLVAFAQIDELLKDYKKIRIQTPNVKNPKPFQQSLADKAKAREKMIKAYTSIVTEYQQAESTVASLFRIAQCWDDFVGALTSVPCPRGVGDEVCQLIKQGIEETVSPARDAAFLAYKTCVDKSNELNTFTPYSTDCVKALEKLAPEAYPQIQEQSRDYQSPSRLQGMPSNPLILQYDGYSVAKQAQAANSEAPKKGER